jgi:hypothetical protein
VQKADAFRPLRGFRQLSDAWFHSFDDCYRLGTVLAGEFPVGYRLLAVLTLASVSDSCMISRGLSPTAVSMSTPAEAG